MILRKPYAFIIKYFKLIHFLLTLPVAYLIYRTNVILSFLSDYINSNTSVVGQNLVHNLFNSLCFILPVLIIIFSFIFLGIMYKKQKPYLFYMINIFIFIAFLVTLMYSYGMIGQMESIIIDIRPVKIIHDLLIILIGLEVISFIIFLIRAIGFDIKKFDFLSDVNNFDINESDKEEFEFNINIDFDDRKRRKKRRLRYLKYAYKENRLFINTVIAFMLLIGMYFVYTNTNLYKKIYSEKNVINFNNYSISVDESYITNKNYLNKKIDDNSYLVVTKIKTKAFTNGQKLDLSNFKLKINSSEFVSTNEYKNEIKDLGISYLDEEISTGNYNYYLVSFLIPHNLINDKMILKYNNYNKKAQIKLSPIKIDENITNKKYNIKDKISFKNSIIDNPNISINSYELADKFKIQYDFKSRDGSIYPSIEYITPNVDSNYDKALLKINAIYTKNNSMVEDINKFITTYGTIKYKINNTIKIQNNLVVLNSIKKANDNNYYIEINKEIKNASNCSLVFKIRNNEYEYILF